MPLAGGLERNIMADLSTLKGVDSKDRKMIEDAEALLGPEPASMGFVKNLFWGGLREELVFPYPEEDAEEKAECDKLLARLDDYLRNEHPSIKIDQDQEIPLSDRSAIRDRRPGDDHPPGIRRPWSGHYQLQPRP